MIGYSLCLGFNHYRSLPVSFSWASFRQHKAAVKMHTLLDIRGNIPTFIEITDRSVHDVNIRDVLVPEAGSCYIMDRGYLDFARPALSPSRPLLFNKRL